MNIVSKYQKLRKWLKKPLGELLLEEEKKHLSSCFDKIQGECLLILGDLSQASLAQDCRIKQHIVLAPTYPKELDLNLYQNLLCVDYEALPILQDSVDAVLLPHTLDFAENPDQVLREVENALHSEGHLILIGFNSMSLFGLRHLFSSRKNVPWSGSFKTVSRIKDWLKLLNFEIITTQRIFYRPPIANMAILHRLKFLDYIGKYCFPLFGSVYIMMAKKRVLGVTPLRLAWKKLALIVPKGIVEPARRSIHRE